MEAPPYAGDPTFERLRRSFQPADLLPELQAAGVHYTIAVEAADDPAENESLLATARHHDWIARVIGWVPLADPDEVTELDARAAPPGRLLATRSAVPRPAAARVPPASLGRRLGRSAAGNATDESTKWFSPADADPQVSRPPRCWSRIGRRTCVLSRQGPVARPRPCPRWRPRRLGSRVGARRRVDVFLVRKLGVPQWRELAMGALASGGGVVMNDDVVSSLRITDQQVRAAIDSETAELQRRELAYRGGRPVVDPRARIVILVDDGIATGASMLAAVRTIRATGPESIVVAVPVGPATACRELAAEADDVVCATMPAAFEAVGQVYNDFHQVTDDEVRELLATPTTGAAT